MNNVKRDDLPMFKSVFTKYIVLITLLMSFSFALLVLIISTMLASYSADQKEGIISSTADCLFQGIGSLEITEESLDDKELLSQIRAFTLSVSRISGSFVYVTDDKGTILASNDTAYTAGKKLLEQETADMILAGYASKYTIGRIDETFDKVRYNDIRTVINGDVRFIIIVSSTTIGDTELSGAMIRTVIIVAIWVLLISSITAYILFQRVLDPLKSLSAAAKSFAKGDFTKRVYVTGNDEVADLANAFNNMATVLEKNEENRNSFLGSVSHDLRTPMTVISGFVDGIRDGTIPPEKQDYYLGVISSEVRRLTRLVNTLLEISRVQSGEKKLTLTRFNISEKARQVLLSFEKKIDEKKIDIEFNCDSDITVNADQDAVHQILYNLTDNAVKFVNEGGKLSLTLAQEGKNCRITIRNTGAGIPAEEIPHVFERFYKSDRSRGLDKNGTGLGLFIVKTNVNMHGGEITVQSVTGEYTEFSFTLPM